MGRDVVSIVVVYRSAADIADCLDSIFAAFGTGARIIVVDNASPDASAEIAAAHPSAPRVIRSARNVGFGAACNLAAATSTAEYLLFVNPDARLPADVVDALLATMLSTGIGAVGPRIEDPVGEFRAASAGFEPSIRSALGHFLFLGRLPGARRIFPPLQLPPGARSQTVDWVGGAALLVRNVAFRSVNGFDPTMFMYMEDVDLCRRLREAGWTIRYDATGAVRHAMGGSQGSEQVVRWYQAFHAYLVRQHGRSHARVADALAAIGLGLRALMFIPTRRSHAMRMARGARTALRLAISRTHDTMARRPLTDDPSAGNEEDVCP